MFSIILSVLLFGCAQKQPAVICSAPNVLIGNVCCLDADSNSVCDTREVKEEPKKVVEKEELDVQPVEDALQTFANDFEKTWNRKSYTALHGMFEKNYRLRFSPQEFNFLARKMDAKLGIQSVSIYRTEKTADGTVVKFQIELPEEKKIVSAEVRTEGDLYKFASFDFFDDLSADAVCEGNESCYDTMAAITSNRNYCDKAGSLKAECIERFGVAKSITSKIDECTSIVDLYGVAECLTSVAVKENVVEPCWHNEYDKQTYECIGEVAAARADVNECNTLVASRGMPGSRLQKTYCILAYVRVTADTDACAKIDRRDDVMLGSMQEGCYRLQFP